MSAVSRNVDVFGSGKSKSERHKSFGLIEAKRDLDDERLILLSLTDKGNNFLKLVLEASYGNLED
jgi:DNA-binding MarR family transcriptional regulator